MENLEIFKNFVKNYSNKDIILEEVDFKNYSSLAYKEMKYWKNTCEYYSNFCNVCIHCNEKEKCPYSGFYKYKLEFIFNNNKNLIDSYFIKNIDEIISLIFPLLKFENKEENIYLKTLFSIYYYIINNVVNNSSNIINQIYYKLKFNDKEDFIDYNENLINKNQTYLKIYYNILNMLGEKEFNYIYYNILKLYSDIFPEIYTTSKLNIIKDCLKYYYNINNNLTEKEKLKIILKKIIKYILLIS